MRTKIKAQQKNHTPYLLGVVEGDTDHIYVSGDTHIIKQLGTIPYTKICKIEDTDLFYVQLPASRTNFMIAEAMAIPDSVSPEYIKMRNEYMQTPQNIMDEWFKVCPRIRPERALKDFQHQICALAYSIPGLLNASEQGTGKTIESIALIGAWKKLKTLVIVPKSIIWQWNTEFTKTLYNDDDTSPDHFHIIPLDVSVKECVSIINDLHILEEADEKVILITNYEKIHGLNYALMKWNPDVIIVDESWRIKNITSDITKRMIILSDISEKVNCLNGTPFGQNVTDLWPQLRVTSPTCGNDLPTYMMWEAMYSTSIYVGYGQQKITGVRQPSEVMQHMAGRFARATKQVCLPELPEKYDPVQVEIPFTDELADLYLEICYHGDAVFDPMSLVGDRITTIRKQQFTSGLIRKVVPRLFNQKERLLNKYPQAAKQKHTIIASPKRDWCVQYVKDVMLGNPQMRVIFWCKFTLTIEALTEALMGVLGDDAVFPVTGATDTRELEQIKESFNGRSPDGIRALVVQTQKMAYGQNLQGCDWNILYDHSWSYIERDQLEDRSHRMGRQGPVGYTELIGVIIKNGKEYDTVDSEILKATYEREMFAKRFGPDTTGHEEE